MSCDRDDVDQSIAFNKGHNDSWQQDFIDKLMEVDFTELEQRIHANTRGHSKSSLQGAVMYGHSISTVVVDEVEDISYRDLYLEPTDSSKTGPKKMYWHQSIPSPDPMDKPVSDPSAKTRAKLRAKRKKRR
jgi:hypothetical protein